MKLYKLRILVLILLLFSCMISASGQMLAGRSKAPPLKQRIFYGGSFGLQFGTYTNIEASPFMGVWLLPRLSVAAGPKYQFYKDPFDKTDIYGGRGFIRFNLIQDMNNIIPLGLNLSIFADAEYEMLSLKSDYWRSSPVTNERFLENAILVGGGISQGSGGRSSVNIVLLWLVTPSAFQIYGNPEIRIEFTF